MLMKYPTPAVIENIDIYQTWLDRKASAHFKRDQKYWQKKKIDFIFTKEDYKIKIHEAVCKSEGKDFFTREQLRWDLLSEYGKEKNYDKSMFSKLPTLDHYDRTNPNLIFVITSWAVNDAKNDLSYEELLVLCQKILDHKEKCISDFKKLQE